MLSASYHPIIYGQAKRDVQTLKKCLKTLSTAHDILQEKLNQFLMQYQKMPHITTREMPILQSLFFKRNTRTKTLFFSKPK